MHFITHPHSTNKTFGQWGWLDDVDDICNTVGVVVVDDDKLSIGLVVVVVVDKKWQLDREKENVNLRKKRWKIIMDTFRMNVNWNWIIIIYFIS